MATPTTAAAKVREILKCGRDPVYFMNEYCKIQHPQRGLIPFATYPFQDDCVSDFVEHRFNVVLKSRQLGLSTVTAAYAVWMALFHKEKNILVIATKLKTAINFVKKIKVILTSIPSWLKISDFNDNRQEVRFANGSYIQAIPTSDDAGRSEALSLLIVDEAAFIRNFEEIWTGLYPTLSTGGSAIILSTPNGVGGMYYNLYTGAEAKSNEFNPIKLFWDVHPEHDQTWFEKEARQLGSKRKVAQELMCTFVGSGDTYIGADDIAHLNSLAMPPNAKGLDMFPDGPHEEKVHERDVWIWEYPNPGHEYIISADVARGDGKDFSAFHILDATSAEIVVEYMGKLPPERLGIFLDRYGRRYNNALVCPENNTFGNATCTRLRDLKYPRLVYQNVPMYKLETYIPQPDDRIGFSTQTKSREIALAKLEELVRNKVIKSYSSRLVNQLRTFIWNGSKAEAMKNENDDLVMSTAIACWLFDGLYGTATTKSDTTPEMMLKMMMKASSSLNQVPGAGHEVRPFSKPGFLAMSMYRPQAHNASQHGVDDFSWLMR